MKKVSFKSILIFLFLTIIMAFAVYPIIVMFLGSFKTAAELSSNPAGIPAMFTLNNYKRLLDYNAGLMIRAYLNAIFITVSYTAITLFISSMAAFAFAKYNFKGRNVMFALLLATMMIPAEVNIPPLYIMFSKIDWLNTYYVQIFPHIANVFAMFMLKQYMEGIPSALIEAAKIDGAKHWKVYSKIIMPVSIPALGALTILVFINKWNEYLWPIIMVNKPKFLPITVILPTLNDNNSVWSIPWELVLTGCVLVTIPLLICFLIFQEKFMASATSGAVKE